MDENSIYDVPNRNIVSCLWRDGDEETTGEDVSGTEEDTTEAEDVDDSDEDVDATEEEDESEDENEGSGDFAEDQQLTLGETGTYDANFGTFEITLDDVRAEDEVEGEPPVSDLYIITEVTIENASEDAIEVEDFTFADLEEEGGTGIGVYMSDGFDEEIDPGELTTGELIFDDVESSYYNLVYGYGSDSLSNEVRWEFDADELDE